MSNEIITTVQDSTPTQKGVSTSNGGGGGEDKIVVLSEDQTLTPEDKTIYIIYANIIFIMPEIARLGFRYKCIGIRGCVKMKIFPDSDQTLKWKGDEGKSDLVCDGAFGDISMLCYEQDKKFKWLTYLN